MNCSISRFMKKHYERMAFIQHGKARNNSMLLFNTNSNNQGTTANNSTIMHTYRKQSRMNRT